MFNIQNYLGRFKKISEDKQELKKIVKEIVKSVTNVTLTDEEIIIKGRSLKIKADSSIKAVLFMKKKAITNALKENPITKSLVEIE